MVALVDGWQTSAWGSLGSFLSLHPEWAPLSSPCLTFLLVPVASPRPGSNSTSPGKSSFSPFPVRLSPGQFCSGCSVRSAQDLCAYGASLDRLGWMLVE